MCQDYECAWLEGHGEPRDRPDRTGILTAGKETQFGLVLVAQEVTRGAASSRRGRRSLDRIAGDAGLPCLVMAPKTERVDRVHGPHAALSRLARENPELRIYPDGTLKQVK